MNELPSPEGTEPKPTPFEEKRRQIIESELTPGEKRRQIIELNQRELTRRIEAGELDKNPYELNYLVYLQNMDEPLTRRDIGNQAVVITQKGLEQLGYLEIVLASGQKTVIDPEDTGYGPDDPIIIFPEELGELPKDQTP